MKQITTYVGIDAHKKDLFIAMLVSDSLCRSQRGHLTRRNVDTGARLDSLNSLVEADCLDVFSRGVLSSILNSRKDQSRMCAAKTLLEEQQHPGEDMQHGVLMVARAGVSLMKYPSTPDRIKSMPFSKRSSLR